MRAPIQPFTYADRCTPEGYACTACGATECKIYREYQTIADATDLYCAACAFAKQEKPVESPPPDNIGWLVAAVPTEDGRTFWGYTSVPDAGCKWWYALPDAPATVAA